MEYIHICTCRFTDVVGKLVTLGRGAAAGSKQAGGGAAAGDKPPRGWAATGGKPRGGGKEGLVAKLADREGLLLSLILAVRMKLSPVPQARVSGIWTCLSSWSRFT